MIFELGKLCLAFPKTALRESDTVLLAPQVIGARVDDDGPAEILSEDPGLDQCLDTSV